LLETIAVVVILLVLAGLIVPVAKTAIHRTEGPRCTNNLRNLHVALNTYLIDNKSWPQLPEDIELDTDPESYFWIKSLEPYGMVEKNWKCPTILRFQRGQMNLPEISIIHYKPTIFDAHEFAPRQWDNMPWAIEVGDMHGRGNLILFGNGDIRGSREKR
jgi:hypothetical protein